MEERVVPLRPMSGRGPDKDVVANDAAMEATKQLRRLGDELRAHCEALDANRATLKKAGIVFDPTFERHVTAALSVLRGEPYWDRAPSV